VPGRSTLRRTLTLALSLVLCLLVLACWVRSYWVRDYFSWGTPHSDNVIASTGGRLIYADDEWPNTIPVRKLEHRAERRSEVWWLDAVEHTDGFSFLGFEYTREAFPYQNTVHLSFFLPIWRVLAIPYWAPFALLALHPFARAMSALHRARRLRQVRCVECGYDVRASSERCPECGTAIPASNSKLISGRVRLN
jgi:hypothetical protein